jgi:hypothetical protein
MKPLETCPRRAAGVFVSKTPRRHARCGDFKQLTPETILTVARPWFYGLLSCAKLSWLRLQQTYGDIPNAERMKIMPATPIRKMHQISAD